MKWFAGGLIVGVFAPIAAGLTYLAYLEERLAEEYS